jgi:hypothetical protein
MEKASGSLERHKHLSNGFISQWGICKQEQSIISQSAFQATKG